MNRIIGLACLLLLVGCETAPVGDPLPPPSPVPVADSPVAAPAHRCSTTYWNEDLQAGFNPPDNMTGPQIDYRIWGPRHDGLFRADWERPAGDITTPEVIMSSYSTSYPLEEEGAMEAYRGTYETVRSERITLDSGQPGWLVIKENKFELRGEFGWVIVLTVLDGERFAIRMFGDLRYRMRSYDIDRMIGIGRTLCAK